MSWSTIPIELTLRILTFFDPTELVNFRRINSFFKSLIDETTTLQYRIALFASGMEDGPPGDLTTSERLELLRGYEASWKNPEWTEHNTIISSTGGVWELYGNVWAHSKESDAIEFIQLPSRIRGIHMRQWTLKFDFSVRDFSMDPSQDLLVMIEIFRNTPGLSRIQLRTLSTGEKHPLAERTAAVVEHTLSVPEVILSRWSHSIRICEDYVAILFMELFDGRNELVVWSWRTGVQKLVVLSAHLRSFAFLGDKFILGSTLEPPALLVYSIEQRPASGVTQDSTHVLCFLFGAPFEDARAVDILLTSDPSPGWSPSAGLQVPFHIAGDERIIAMNLQISDNRRVHFCETSLISTETLLRYIDTHLIEEGHEVGWDLYGPLLSEKAPGHGRWDAWACFVFGMRYILPKVFFLHGKPMAIIRDLCPRRYLRASKEELEESNTLYKALMGGTGYLSYTRSILRIVPLPESIGDPRTVKLMISEGGIVVREPADTNGNARIHFLTC